MEVRVTGAVGLRFESTSILYATRTVLKINTYGIKISGKDNATNGAKNNTRPSWDATAQGTCQLVQSSSRGTPMSTLARSCKNRFKMLPTGVLSKKFMDVETTAVNILLCNVLNHSGHTTSVL